MLGQTNQSYMKQEEAGKLAGSKRCTSRTAKRFSALPWQAYTATQPLVKHAVRRLRSSQPISTDFCVLKLLTIIATYLASQAASGNEGTNQEHKLHSIPGH